MLSTGPGLRSSEVSRSRGSLTAATLLVIAGLHVMWGLGSPFPFRDREQLADSVVGSSEVPPLGACLAVAAALTLAAMFVMRLVPLPRRVRAGALRVAAATLATRWIAGAMGKTSTLSPGSDSIRFRRLDRRLYSPLCLWLAAGIRRSL